MTINIHRNPVLKGMCNLHHWHADTQTHKTVCVRQRHWWRQTLCTACVCK